jgi:tRNA pseudouridine55 synthase
MDGILNLHKPYGLTSHDCVAAVRKLLPGRKVGHAGTLDPAATGVLPVCIGRATRIAEYLMEHSKGYRAGVQLGITTDTDDAQGKILQEHPVPGLREDELQDILQDLTGLQEQIPPAYSAVKHRGRPLYYWTRRGEPVKGKPRTVTIYKLALRQYDPSGCPHLTLDIECSRGTYIRTLAAEIGLRIGCGAHLWSLVRSFVGSLRLEDASTLEDLQAASVLGDLKRFIIPMDRALKHLPSFVLEPAEALDLKHGRVITRRQPASAECGTDGAPIRIYNRCGNFLALARWEAAGDTAVLKTVKYLATDEGDHLDGID